MKNIIKYFFIIFLVSNIGINHKAHAFSQKNIWRFAGASSLCLGTYLLFSPTENITFTNANGAIINIPIESNLPKLQALLLYFIAYCCFIKSDLHPNNDTHTNVDKAASNISTSSAEL